VQAGSGLLRAQAGDGGVQPLPMALTQRCEGQQHVVIG
jgi:hypothetical protein